MLIAALFSNGDKAMLIAALYSNGDKAMLIAALFSNGDKAMLIALFDYLIKVITDNAVVIVILLIIQCTHLMNKLI